MGLIRIYDTSSSFWLGLNVFSTTVFLNPKSSEFQHRVLQFFFGVYLSHGVFHLVALFFSSKISFQVGYRASSSGEDPQKKRGAPLA